jgi:O-antigen/teichoic acid export membrane protein
MWRFGAPLILANLGFFVIHFSDRYFLGAARGLGEVGIYAMAYKFAFMVTFAVGEPFGRVWNVSLYSYTKDPNWERQFARVARYLTLALCTASLGLCLFGPQIIRIMATSAYSGAIALLPILTFAYVAREVGDFFRQILYINKRSGAVGKIAMVSAVVNLALNFALIGRFGMMGAAWATLLTWSFYLVLCWMRANAEHAIPFDKRSFAIVVGASAAVYLLVAQQPNLPLLLDLGTRLVWLVAFLGLVWMFRYFPEEELVLIRGKVGRLWRAI